MSRFPSMPMYVDALLADTEHLTNEEFGVYHRLLYAMWRRNGWVPDDDRDLARICHVSRQRWQHLKVRLMEFLIFKDGEISQKKLLMVRGNCEKISQKNSQNAAARWHGESNKNKDITDASGYASRARVSKTITKDSALPLQAERAIAPSSDSLDALHPRENGDDSAGEASLGLEGRYASPMSALTRQLIAKGLHKS